MNLKEVTLVPSKMWGGQGVLGVSIRFCSFDRANENVWHILDVQANSPASLAGLRSNADYIIGSDSHLTEPEDLFTLIESSENKQLKLYVYNFDLDAVREVLLTPNSAWGGDGALGCGIGYGYLHRIPIKEDKTAISHNKNDAKNMPNISVPSITTNSSSVGSNLSALSTMTNIGSQSSLLNFSNQTSVSSNMSNISNLSTVTNIGSQSSLMSTDSTSQVHNNLANLSLNHINDVTAPTQMSQFLHASATNLPSQVSPSNQNKLPPLPSLFGSNPPPPPQTTPFTPAFQQPQQTFNPQPQIFNPATQQTMESNSNQVTDFSQYFQPDQNQQQQTALSVEGAYDPSQNSNQMIQNLVQQTISKHFNQQQNQNTVQETEQAVNNEGHGHSHDHSAHGHSH